MKKTRISNRVIALFMAITMVFSIIPVNAFATDELSSGSVVSDEALSHDSFVDEEKPVDDEEPVDEEESADEEESVGYGLTREVEYTYYKVLDVTNLTVDEQIIIVAAEDAYALGTEQKTNNRGQGSVTKSDDGNTVTFGADVQIITLEEGTTEGTFAFNVGGSYLYAASSSSNYLKTQTDKTADASWKIEITDGIAGIVAQGENIRNVLRYNKSSDLFACYEAGKQGDVLIYTATEQDYDEGSGNGGSGNEGSGEEPVIPDQPGEVTVSTIADAKAMATDATATVKGTVIFVDGKNVVVQDSTGGINLYFSTAPADITSGDVVQATGTRATYNGLEQLKNVTEYSKDGTAGLPAAETTIAAILADQETGLLESTRVVIKDAVIGAINTSGNTPLTVGDSTINIYKIPALDGIGEGDTVNVTAVISDYNGYQLRVADAAGVELVKKAEVTEPEQPDDPQDPVDGFTWTKVALAEIAETDTVAITMSKEGTTWVLPNVGGGSSGQPLAVTGTVTDDVLTTDVAETYSWNIKAVEGGYNITSGDNYLYLTATNNGMRIGADAAVWNITDGYLTSVDSAEATRYVGVYNSQDWRCYTSINNQISSQTLEFWKLGGSTETEDNVAIKDGTYVIYEATNSKAATALATDKTYGYLQPVVVTVADGTVTGYGKEAAWSIENISDGNFTIKDASGRFVYMSGTYNSFNVSDSQPESGYLWTAVANEDGTVKLMNVEMSKYISYDETYSSFGAYDEPSDTQKANLTLVSFVEPEEEEPDVGTVGIADGDYVIWAPAYNMALSSNYNGSYYNPGVKLSVSGSSVSGYGNSEIWTVTNNEDGTITISCSEGKLAMGTGFSSMPLNEVNDTWTLEDAGNGQYYVKNVGRECYIEWYESKSYWSGYKTISAGSEGMFALKFTPAEKGLEVDSSIVEAIASWGGGGEYSDTANATVIQGDRYTSGDQLDANAKYTVVVSGANVKPFSTSNSGTGGTSYYMGGKGIGSGSNDYAQFAVNTAGWGNTELSFRMRASNTAPGSFQLCYSKDGGNTWVNFTEGTYKYAYTSYNGAGESYVVEGDGAISDGIAKTSMAPANYITFTFAVPSGADNCENLLIRMVPGTDAAKAGGTIKNTGVIRVDSVVLAGSPIVDSSITGYVAVTPDGAEDQAVGTELTMESATEGATIYYRVNGGNWATYNAESKPTLAALPCNVEAYAASDGRADSVVLVYTYAAGSVATVKFTPNGGGVYIEGESSEIVLSSDTAGATIYYATSEDGIVFSDYGEYTAPIVIGKGFGKLSVKAYAHKDGYKDSIEVIRDFTERLSDRYNIYFGQLHAHTNISDGSGDIKEAFEHASNVKNLDFLAVTDHSNSFDNDGSGVLAQDGSSVSSEWALGHAEARNITSEDFVGIYGFEMTWSNGLGHINTFNTPGWQSRTQNDYKTYGTALQNYYTALATVPASISQFNHPGTTFGDFSDFAHYTEERDDLITLIEVGNGEGAIGSSGYFPSYEYYTRALDKGWHVAPTNNQDNHKGLWGDANTGRSVVLVDSLTESNIYDAMRNYRVYATEDNDLGIYYTLDGNIMGTILDSSDVGGTVDLSVTLADPTDSANATVSVIVNGGYAAASQTATCNDTVTFSVPSSYNYYYIKAVQADGDIAVTAPVWIGKVEAVGVSSLTAASDLTIAGEKQTFNLELFNNEKKDLLVSSLVFTNKDTGEVIYTDSTISQVGAESTAACTFDHIFDKNGIYTIRATVKGTLNGVEKTYTQDLEITVMPAEITSKVIVDGTHFNDYVTGYYGGNTGNMTTIAAAQGIKVHVETEKITAEMLDDCSLLVISAPAKKNGTANAGDYTASLFEDEFIDTVKAFVQSGGSVIVCGLADYQDKGAPSADYHTAAQLNKLLEAIGSSLRINDDEAYDEENNGGQAYRLYPSVFNSDSKWCNGLVEGQTYSQYSGCTVDAGNGTWLVKGFDTTYSIDSDADGVGGLEKGNAVFIAAEDTGYGGTVFASGGVFVSDFEVKAELDNMWDLPYANRTIYENILGITRKMPKITPIAEVRQSAAVALGEIFVVEGYVTAGTANPNTKFFDTIYLQDETGGITIFPYSELGLELGTKMRITGNTEHYQGDFEIQIMSYEILDADKKIIDPEKMSAKDAMDYGNNGGELIQVQGEVVSVTMSNGVVSEFVVKDEQGDEAKVFIDGYILSGTTGKNELADIVKEGNTVSAVGLLYLHPEGDSEVSVAVLRVRDCDEIIVQESIPTGHRFEMREDQIICSVCGEQLMINLAQDYVALTVGESIELEVSPAEFAEHIEWILDGDEDIITMDGNVVTAVTPGSVYVNAAVTAGEFESTVRFRVDVASEIQIDGVQLSSNKVTAELYKNEFSTFEVLLQLPRNYPADTLATAQSAAMSLAGMEHKGIAIDSAKFTDETMDKYFDLIALDDRTVQIVPTRDALDNAKSVKSKYAGTVTITVDGKDYVTEKLTLTVKKTIPKLKAKINTFNSFYPDQSQSIVITGGTVTEIRENEAKNTAKATPIPTWLTLDEEGKGILTLNNAPDKSVSGKAYIEVWTDEWRIPAHITLSVKNTYKVPTLKLSATSATLNTLSGDEKAVTITSSFADYDLTRLEVTHNAGDALTVEQQADGFTVSTNEKTLTNKTYKITVRDPVNAKIKAVTMTVRTVGKNPAMNSLKVKGTMDVTFPFNKTTLDVSLKDYAGTFEPELVIEDREKNDVTGQFSSVWNGTAFEITPSGAAKGSYTATVSVTIDMGENLEDVQLVKAVKLTVKQTLPKVKLSATNVTLNKKLNHNAVIDVFSATKGYELEHERVSVVGTDQVEAIYANGQITLSLKEGAAYGKTYNVTVRAYDGAPAVTLRVAVPAEKKSNISASIKASGFIDVIREGTVITVTPTFVNAFASDVDADSMSLKFYRKDGKTWTEVKGNEIPFACDPDENGRFVITAKESLVHTDKYQVELVARIDGKEILSKRIDLTVKMGSAKLTVKASDTTLFAKDKNDRALFWFETKDATLNEVTRVAFKDAKQAATFELIDYGDGTYAIGFKNGKVNEKMVGKSVTVNLNVFIEGNETAKANDAVSVKLTVVK